MMGTAPGFVPETLERDLIDEIFLASEAQAFGSITLSDHWSTHYLLGSKKSSSGAWKSIRKSGSG